MFASIRITLSLSLESKLEDRVPALGPLYISEALFSPASVPRVLVRIMDLLQGPLKAGAARGCIQGDECMGCL